MSASDQGQFIDFDKIAGHKGKIGLILVVLALIIIVAIVLYKKDYKKKHPGAPAPAPPSSIQRARAAYANGNGNGNGNSNGNGKRYPGAATAVVSGSQWAQENWAGHQQFQPNDLRYQALPAGSSCGMSGGTGGCGVPAMASCQPSVEPGAYFPYSGGQGAAAFDSAYPNEEDMSSQGLRGCATGQQAAFQLNVNSLMPAAWRSGSSAQCGAGSGGGALDGSQWAKYAPTKEAFDRYITAQGSARLSINTRSPLGRQVGTPNLLRSQPPMPLAAESVVFNDSSARQDMVFKELGVYPQSTSC